MNYFAQNIKHLRRKSSKTQEQLGNEVSLGRTTIANYESGASSPTDPEVLVRLSSLFRVSVDELLKKDLSDAFNNKTESFQQIGNKHSPAVVGFFQNKLALYESTAKMNHYIGTPKVIVVASNGEEQMVFVSLQEMKNYIINREDSAYISSLPNYSFPKFTDNTYRLFEMGDQAMEPKFAIGDKVVAAWVSNLEEISDTKIYVFVTTDYGILVRRVANRVSGQGNLYLISDTIHYKNQYPPIEVSVSQVLEVWVVEYVISSNLAQPLENMHGRIADLEMRLHERMKKDNQ